MGRWAQTEARCLLRRVEVGATRLARARTQDADRVAQNFNLLRGRGGLGRQNGGNLEAEGKKSRLRFVARWPKWGWKALGPNGAAGLEGGMRICCASAGRQRAWLAGVPLGSPGNRWKRASEARSERTLECCAPASCTGRPVPKGPSWPGPGPAAWRFADVALQLGHPWPPCGLPRQGMGFGSLRICCAVTRLGGQAAWARPQPRPTAPRARARPSRGKQEAEPLDPVQLAYCRQDAEPGPCRSGRRRSPALAPVKERSGHDDAWRSAGIR